MKQDDIDRTIESRYSAITYLKKAERYANARNDLAKFTCVFNTFRLDESIQESVWLTLNHLYGEDVAYFVQNCDKDVFYCNE